MNMLNFVLLQAPAGGGSGFEWYQYLLLGGIFLVMYFFMIRPQTQKAKEQASYQDTLQKGDKVVMNSGMHAKIVSMDEKTVTVEVEGGIKMKFEKGFISMDLTKIANQAKNKEVTTK